MFSALINSCVESGTHTIPLGICSSNRNKTGISSSFLLIRGYEVWKLLLRVFLIKIPGSWVASGLNYEFKGKNIISAVPWNHPVGLRRLQGVLGGLGASQMHAQSSATPSRLHDIIATWIKGLLSGFRRKRKRNRILCVGSPAPSGNYADACSSCSLGMLASCPAWQLQEFCKTSEGEFPLQPWLRHPGSRALQTEKTLPFKYPESSIRVNKQPAKAGQLAVQPRMEKTYSPGNQPVEVFFTNWRQMYRGI